MTVDPHQQEIKELYLSRSKVTHKVQDRIELYQTLIDQAEKYSLPAYAACFRGYLAWIKKDFGQALSYFREAIQTDGALPYPWHGQGNVYYYDLKKLDKAKECFEKAIDLDDTYAFPWNSLGVVYKYLKQNVKAIECYEKANRIG